jgi:hypothetical protein
MAIIFFEIGENLLFIDFLLAQFLYLQILS